MAPTEILAAQHAAKLADIFEGTHVSVGLLTGSMTAKQHKQLLNEIKAGTINLVVGTHALIQDKVDYANLGLAIIDEQHRFGVRQRQLLRKKRRESRCLGDDGHADSEDAGNYNLWRDGRFDH
jgi:ATP-dependent DNA helicase RecG